MKMKRTLTSKSLSLTSLIALDLSQNGHESPSRNSVTIRGTKSPSATLFNQTALAPLLSDSHSVPTGSGFIGFDVTLLVNQIREDLIDNDLEKQG
ncbi:hypothetical protein BLNAU_23996 [Blattamonas nauphoetae]|uniref:Uncharacterized protein n=1 Tax=Blattamonas nauphoetae TaxID=2049346 RepID=A0ABQ9WPM9_9EUKA|nr:hypothetical protein BLNAU_23996 [Blattamonas nauphoetae]